MKVVFYCDLGTDRSMTITSQSMESVYKEQVKDNAMHGLGVFISKNKDNGFKYEGKYRGSFKQG
jgi:hypothetical protein